MSRRSLFFPVLAVLLSVVLAACSTTDNRNLSGAAAKDALTTVLKASEKKYLAEGGTETVYVGTKRYVLLYDPTAAADKQVAFQDLDTTDAPQLGTTDMIRITALLNLVSKDLSDKATITLSDNTFKIQDTEVSIQISVEKDLMTQAIVTTAANGANQTTMFATTYGFSKDAKKLLSSATPSPAPAQ